jgi:type I restriction enzyme R subunit
MHSKTNEQALEAAIEKHLTGTCLEEIKAQGLDISTVNESRDLYKTGKDYFIGQSANFNARFAIDEQFFWDFLESTQKEELAKIQKQSDWKLIILNRYDRLVKKYGILYLLK